MELIIKILLTFLIVLTIAGIAWLVYHLGFRLEDIKIKAWFFEFILKRKPTTPKKDVQPEKNPASSPTTATQTASSGGVIEKSTIKIPAGSGVKAEQKASGENSKITKSHIELS